MKVLLLAGNRALAQVWWKLMEDLGEAVEKGGLNARAWARWMFVRRITGWTSSSDGAQIELVDGYVVERNDDSRKSAVLVAPNLSQSPKKAAR